MNYLKIDNCNMNNGEGLRVVVWVTGCEHYCPNCFNPETWEINNGSPINEKITNYLLECLKQDWCSGITFSGGDPLHPLNRQELFNLCRIIKSTYPNKNIWVYTGYTFEELNKDQLKDIDVLVDGEFKDELKDNKAHWVGSTNQRVIDIPLTLKENKIIIRRI